MESGIYCIKNLINNKIYVGSAVNINRRIYTHKKRLVNGEHGNSKLQNAYNKHSKFFVFEILELVNNKENLLKREQHWIDNFDSANKGYNICSVAGSLLGRKKPKKEIEKQRKSICEYYKNIDNRNKQSKIMIEVLKNPVTRKKLSKLVSGDKNPQKRKEVRDKTSKTLMGHSVSEETKEKIRNSLLGRRHSKKSCAKMSKIQKIIWKTKERREKQRESFNKRLNCQPNKEWLKI